LNLLFRARWRVVIIYFNCHFERRLATRFMTKQIGGCEKSIWQYYDSFKQDRPLTMGQFEVTGVKPFPIRVHPW
ncbi:MAG: hypothetical protein KBF99_04900, partial [Leptospiraceae bacterium]|nr:hypothetical protein [Leptospiraceae bacterium]